MKVTRIGRSLNLRDLPAEVDGIKTPKRLGPFSIQIMYDGDGNAHKAIILDSYIIPLIVKALEHEEEYIDFVDLRGKSATQETQEDP